MNERTTDAWRRRLVVSTTAILLLPISIAKAQDVDIKDDDDIDSDIEEIIISAKRRVYGNNVVSEEMRLFESSLTSVNAVIDSIPGVSIQEGDTYGFDDWSTTISVRGFQVSLDEQQVGSTIDGMPNGNSNYGGGAKANRYIDSANLGGVEVSQGTADIASRSLEALGGTLNFLTDDPLTEQRVRAQLAIGEFDAQRFYARIDTGEFMGSTRAWFSVSGNQASDWVNGVADNRRDHFAAKLVSNFDAFDLTAYVMYDDIHEDNYQRLFSPGDFELNPEWDQLTDVWSGVPYIDQVFREGWSTLRENTFGYVKAEFNATESLNVSTGVYFHKNEGRGDWIPPYILDVVDNQGGPQSEVLGTGTTNGGDIFGRIFFVDGAGNQLLPTPGCVSSITFPYGGAGPEYDPGCHPANAIAVQSYRHTHYEKERTGLTLDAEWDYLNDAFDGSLRGGVWYEDSTRDEWRDWHKITDTRVGIAFDAEPYWVQYNRSYPQEVTKLYVENSTRFESLTLTLGAKKFIVDVEREDLFGESPNIAISSDSDTLISGGLLWETPVEGLELFAGYAENFKSISDLVLERPESDISALQPETAENIEVGARFSNDVLSVSATAYDINFENRIIFLGPETAAGPNYTIGTNGTYFNAGGIESQGVEVAADIAVMDTVAVYVAYTSNDSEYLGTGDPVVDATVGITPGNTVVGIPDSQLVTGVNFAFNNVRAGISSKYTGKRFIRFDNTWDSEEYTVTDMYVSMSNATEALQGMDITLSVNNVFDESYLAGIAGQGAWIGAPRTFSISATFDF